MSRREEYLRKQQRIKDFNTTQQLVMTLFLSALNREFKFGHDRLTRLLEAVEKEAGFITSGMIDIDNYIASVSERIGIKIDDVKVEESE